MYKIILIDDERNGLEVLQWQLRKYSHSLQIVATCTSPLQAIEEIRKHQPDLIFLDIEMPQMNGFDMLQQLSPVSFDVIFTTAYSEFAIRAFRANALDYLLKPIDGNELQLAVQKFERNKAGRTDPVPEERPIKNVRKRLAIATGGSMVFIDPENVAWCEGDEKQTYFSLMDEKLRVFVSRSIQEMEDMLAGNGFCRTNRSYLVNLSHVKQFMNAVESQVVMNDGAILPLDLERKEKFIRMLSNP